VGRVPSALNVVRDKRTCMFLKVMYELLDVFIVKHFYAQKQLLFSARLSHRNSVRLSVRLSVTRVDQSKTVQAKITKFSPSAAQKTPVSGAVKLFHKFEEGHPERGC